LAERVSNREWHCVRAELDEFERDCGDSSQLELLQFQHRELKSLDLQPGEYGLPLLDFPVPS
ncbi:MAG: hypothetical protein R6V72_12040, partial [Cyclobacterium sp.]|uniref:hypothetical protein n=1 Tax=Cyclobacterium sp. TaxID=1966343 RepID=UPI00397106FF